MGKFLVSRKDNAGSAVTVDSDDLMATCARLSNQGAFALNVTPVAPIAPAVVAATAPVVARVNSTFDGALVTDESAKVRIEAQHSALRAAGVAVDAGNQLYATGVRMADIGYATQTARKVEHDRKLPIAQVAEELRATVEAERRRDVEITARDFGRKLAVNGKITFDGMALGEQAIRGLASRLESPMLGYVLGLRDRIAASAKIDGSSERIARDKQEIAEVLAHECAANPDVTIKLRTRQGVGDVFAIVSPGYEPADAPQVIGDLIADLPHDAKGSYSYDPTSTAWELRANVWTPTPVEEQAVGEAFEGYASYRSRDNGTSRFRGGGGITLLRCLNASTYCADGVEVARVHRRGIRRDVDNMTVKATAAIKVLCAAWGVNRGAVVDLPEGTPIGVAIPGFWRFALKSPKSELAGVLPGRSETHVEGLTKALVAEKRDPQGPLVRADFAQGWTRYVQDQPTPVRRDAEVAIGDWLMASSAKLGCEARN
jgi:hypothetical protein